MLIKTSFGWAIFCRLRADLEKEHKRVFEALGSRAKAEYSDDQLSGLGFSSTSHNDVVVKVDNKSFKIVF